MAPVGDVLIGRVLPCGDVEMAGRMRQILWLVLMLVGCQPAIGQSPASDAKSAPPTAVDIEETLDRALIALRKAEARGPDAKEAFDRASSEIRSVLVNDPLNPRARYYQGRLMILGGRSRDARSLIERWTLSAEGRNDWEAHFLLGKIYAAGGYNKLVKPSLKRALALNPRNPGVYRELAKCEMHLLEYDAAVGHAREAIRTLGPNVTPAEYLLLAQLLVLQHHLEEANTQTQSAIDLATSAAGKKEAGVDELRILDDCLAMALNVQQAMLDAEPGNGEHYLSISKLIQRRAEIDLKRRAYDALVWAKRGLENVKNAPEGLYLDAIRLMVRVGRSDEATEYTRRMLEAYPDSADAKSILGSLSPERSGPATGVTEHRSPQAP